MTKRGKIWDGIYERLIEFWLDCKKVDEPGMLPVNRMMALSDELLINLKSTEAMGFENGIQSVIDYLGNEIKTTDKRTAGLPSLRIIECVVLQTVVNALKEWRATEGKEG